MPQINFKDSRFVSWTLGIALVLFIFGFIFTLVSFTKFKNSTKIAIEGYESKIKGLEATLTETTIEKTALAEQLDAEQRKNADFEEQISEIEGTIGDLEKLSKTDPELLNKYSKVYFLNENYIPSGIVQIPSAYTQNDSKDYWLHKQIWPFLEKMIKAAKADRIDLEIISGYRSFDEQVEVKSGHVVVYGAGTANQFSAEQGYSEHQLGTTVDLTTKELGINYEQIETTKAYEWLQKNAYKYGFILSYPEGNTYYQFEPWHWRFVGIKLAKDLNDDGKYFYDLSQREIDAYLINFFDKR
ncbi:MAG: M15 family metallopeptidase [Patescibacteria group bacterium]